MSTADVEARGGGGVDWDAVFSSDTEDEAASAAKIEARVQAATAGKSEGNALLQQGLLKEACAAYRKSLSSIWALYRSRRSGEAVALGTAIDLNLALCYMKLEEWESTRRSTTRALEAEPQNAKGLYRRGVASARLDLLDAAEADLAAALTLSPDSADIRRELQDVRGRIAATKGTGAAIARGFLGNSSSVDAAQKNKHENREVPAEVEQADLEQKDGEPVSSHTLTAEEVLPQLQQVSTFFRALSCRHIICASDEEHQSLLQHLEDVAAAVAEASAWLQEGGAVVEGPLEPETPLLGVELEVEVLLESFASGLAAFKPYFILEERRPGEFDALRICKELLPTSDPQATNSSSSRRSRAFDLELVRWGSSSPATPENFAEALFPPSGQPPDEASAAWQRAAFHRVLQQGASAYAAKAARALLLELADSGAKLTLQGRRVQDVQVACGLFFAGLPPEGPPLPQAAPSANFPDGMAVCTGADRRLVVEPSFTTLGEEHSWLHLQLEDEDAEATTATAPHIFADLCAGALGLLTGSCTRLLRMWGPEVDERFLLVALGRGTTTQSPSGKVPARKEAELQLAAVDCMLSAAVPLSLSLDRVIARIEGTSSVQEGLTEESLQLQEAAAWREAAARLRRAATYLGLPMLQAGQAAPAQPWGTPQAPAPEPAQDSSAVQASEAFRSSRRALEWSYAKRRLCDCGLMKEAAKLP